MPDDQRPAFDRSLDRQQRRDAAVQTRQAEEELRREIADGVDAIDVDPQSDIETRVRDGQVTGGLTRDAQERVVRTEVSESVDEIDVDPQEDIRIETEDGQVVGGSLTRDAQRRVVASELDQQVSRIDVGPDDVDLETENGEVVGGGLTSEAEDRVEAEIQRERRQARNRARRRARREIEEETGMDVSGSDIEIENGEVRPTEEFQREYAAEQLDEQTDTDIGVDDVKLGDDGATLREETQREIAAKQLDEQYSGRDFSDAGNFGDIVSEMQESPADVNIDSEDIQIEDGSVTLREDTQREIAAEQIEYEVEGIGGQLSVAGVGRLGPDVDLGSTDVQLENDSATLRESGQREVAVERFSYRTGAEISGEDVQFGEDGPTLDSGTQQRVVASQLEEEYGIDAYYGDIFVDRSGDAEVSGRTEREIQRTQFAEEVGVDPEDVTFKTVRRSSSNFTPSQSMEDVQVTEEEIPVLEEDAIAERAAAQDPDLEPSDLDIDWLGGDYQIEVTGEAQERIAREEIAQEHDVDPGDIELERTDGEFRAEIDDGDGGLLDSVTSIGVDDVISAPAKAGGAAVFGTASFIDDPVGSTESAISSASEAQTTVPSAAIYGGSTAIDEPVQTAETIGSGGIDIAETVGSRAYSGIVDPIDTSGFGPSIDGTVGEVSRRIESDIDSSALSSEDDLDSVESFVTAPVSAQGAVWNAGSEIATDPGGALGRASSAQIAAQQTSYRETREFGEQAYDFGSDVVEEIESSRSSEALAAAAPLAAAEPTPVGEVAVGAAAIGVGAAAAASVAMDRGEVEVPDDREIRRPEIAAPTDPNTARTAEIGVPESRQPVMRDEFDVPETRDPVMRSEFDTPQSGQESNPLEISLDTTTSTIVDQPTGPTIEQPDQPSIEQPARDFYDEDAFVFPGSGAVEASEEAASETVERLEDAQRFGTETETQFGPGSGSGAGLGLGSVFGPGLGSDAGVRAEVDIAGRSATTQRSTTTTASIDDVAIDQLNEQTPEIDALGTQTQYQFGGQPRPGSPRPPGPDLDEDGRDGLEPASGWVSEDFFNPFASPGEILGFGGSGMDGPENPFRGDSP